MGEAAADRAAPRRLGRYTLVAELATGGMAQLYVAQRDGERTLCVLKRVLAQYAANDLVTRRFVREANLTSRLVHPNIARTLAAGLEGGLFCIVSELVVGQPLAALFEATSAAPVEAGLPHGALPADVAIAMGLQVLDALAYAHTLADEEGAPLGIVHRDLSPRNLLLGYQGEVKVIDFGIARAAVDTFRTAPGVFIGAVEYVPPEQALGDVVDARSDLYTLGVVLYESLTGHKVVRHGERTSEMLRQIAIEVPPLASTRNPGLPTTLDAVLARALEKRREDRWPSAAELRAALAHAAAAGGIVPASKARVGAYLRSVLPDREQFFLDLLARAAAAPPPGLEDGRARAGSAAETRTGFAAETRTGFAPEMRAGSAAGVSVPSDTGPGGFGAAVDDPPDQAPSRLTHLGSIVREMPGDPVLLAPEPVGAQPDASARAAPWRGPSGARGAERLRAEGGDEVSAGSAGLHLGSQVARSKRRATAVTVFAALAVLVAVALVAAVVVATGRAPQETPEPARAAVERAASHPARPAAVAEPTAAGEGAAGEGAATDVARPDPASDEATRVEGRAKVDERPRLEDRAKADAKAEGRGRREGAPTPVESAPSRAASTGGPAPTSDRGLVSEGTRASEAPSHAALLGLLRELRGSPVRDSRRYAELVEGISRASANLSPDARRVIDRELSSAELTYDVDALARALAHLPR